MFAEPCNVTAGSTDTGHTRPGSASHSGSTDTDIRPPANDTTGTDSAPLASRAAGADTTATTPDPSLTATPPATGFNSTPVAVTSKPNVEPDPAEASTRSSFTPDGPTS